ncbi:hypothetical protein [Vibrio cyclitrophicus]|uniref:hypothetical protein n=1 Tax=Vibrio cyclitrophicus TaxID=47951 RepID=UPI000C820DA2|nr:hypothetical protein [Vibrio cyclitrophicus]PME73079.1 hypothetical protein BCV31_13190 [Vibrio cyclitrophicus]
MFDQNERKNINTVIPTYLDNMANIDTKEPNIIVMHELHCDFTASIFETMKVHNTLHRLPELFRDYELFIEDMRRKYSTTQDYGYPIRSPYEKSQGVPFPDYNEKALERLKKRKEEFELNSFDL